MYARPDATAPLRATASVGRPVTVAEPEWRTEGQRQLACLPDSLTQIGNNVGATRQAVAKWRDGDSIPEARFRDALEAAYGIPAASWSGRTYDPAAAAAPPPGDGPEPTVMDDVNDLLRYLRAERQRPDLTARERLQLTEAFSKAVTRKAKLEREREMLEDRTVRHHPKWRALKAALIEALERHPAAARDVEAAIERVIGAEKAARDRDEDDEDDDDEEED